MRKTFARFASRCFHGACILWKNTNSLKCEPMNCCQPTGMLHIVTEYHKKHTRLRRTDTQPERRQANVLWANVNTVVKLSATIARRTFATDCSAAASRIARTPPFCGRSLPPLSRLRLGRKKTRGRKKNYLPPKKLAVFCASMRRRFSFIFDRPFFWKGQVLQTATTAPKKIESTPTPSNRVTN